MKQRKSVTSIITLSLALLILVGYNFISAQSWTAPTGTPPADNVAAPVNIGAAAQDKAGNLGVSGLVAFNNGISVVNSAPQITFNDTDPDNNLWWLHSNAYNGSKGRFHLLYDRNNNGSWDIGDAPASVYIESGATSGEDYAYFSNQVRARQYCDQNGGNCVDASSIAGNCSLEVKDYTTACGHSNGGATAIGSCIEADGWRITGVQGSVKCYTSGSPGYNDYYRTTYYCSRVACN